MKVLIDECVPKVLKVELAASGFDCTTVQEAGWSGKENGELLALADASFDVVVTIDRNLRYQQNLTGRRIALLIVACAFESCGGFRAALLRLRRDVANHSTGHSRRGGVLGVGVLGEAAGPFFRWRVYRARHQLREVPRSIDLVQSSTTG
jgi:predicted nuclease of predicted toxin-antitoxin system